MKVPLDPEHRAKITVNELASLIGYVAKERKRDVFRIFPPALLKNLCTEKQPDSGPFRLKFYEALALLKRRGLMMDTIGYEREGVRTQSVPCLNLTSVGEKTDFCDEILILDDAQKIVDSLKKKIPNLDDVVSQYYLQSLRCCQEDLCVPSAICLGTASERTIYCLGKAISAYYPQKHNIEDRGAADLTKYLLDNDSVHTDQILNPVTTDKAFKRRFKGQLKTMENIYRLNRNEAAHPESVPETTRGEQVALLVTFRKYAETIFKAIELLNP